MRYPKKLFVLVLFFMVGPLKSLQAEDVKITTYYPSPYGSYKQLNVENLDESSTITDFTRSLTRAGLNIITEYSLGSYTPGIFWSTQNDNPTKPKAGIWMHFYANNASRLYLGTSDNFSQGITNQVVISKKGYIGIGTTTPSNPLSIQTTATGPWVSLSGALDSMGETAIRMVYEGGADDGELIMEFASATAAGGTNPKTISRLISINRGEYAAQGGALIFETAQDNTESSFNENQLYLANNGRVGIGANAPQTTLDVNADGGAILVPRKTTTGNPAGVEGMIYYNSADDKFRVYENSTWKDMGTGGGGVACNTVETTYGYTGYQSLSMLVAGTTRNMCADNNGCNVYAWARSAAYPAAIYYYYDAPVPFIQRESGGDHYWHFAYSDRKGTNGDGVNVTILSNSTYGMYLYDDDPSGEVSHDALTVRDNHATYGLTITICDA